MRTFFSVLLACICSVASWGVPAYPRPHKVTNPDGTQITILVRGNEYNHYTTTIDGYTVMKADDGFYYYAHKKNNKISASRIVAADPERRVKSENIFLQALGKDIKPQMEGTGKKIFLQQQLMKKKPFRFAPQQMSSSELRKARANMGANYRGLVLLVNFTDRKFSRGNDVASDYYYNMMNKQGYTGFDDGKHGWQKCTGSVRDYFSDNSYGQFCPEFDVVGPIELDCSQYFINGVENTYALVEKVLRAADSKVDFSRYDADGDGEVDMFYIIYAGNSSNYSGNDQRVVWPHAASMVDDEDESNNIYLDGKRLGRFACSAEIYGWTSDDDDWLDGIGVICHEFSHVLGFEDHYDTVGSNQEDPASWDLMASGSYNGEYNRTPCGYNAYEKYSAGFLVPTLLNDMAGESISMKSLETSKDACMIRSNQENVFFLLENRQPDKWDACLAGYGMLVWRVDSTDARYWEKNVVNTIERPCFKLIRAYGTQGNVLVGVIDVDFDPFPGTQNITELTNETTYSSLVSYDRIATPVVVKDICEGNREISFRIETDEKSDSLPISYKLHEKYMVNAEQLVDNEWKPVSWVMHSGKMKSKTGDYSDAVFNFLPNTENIISNADDGSNELALTYLSMNAGRNIKMEASRLALNSENGIWLCNLTDVENQGSGSIIFDINRHGMPSLKDTTAEIGYCKMLPNAYIVNKKKMISRLNVFRNITFSEWKDDATDIPKIISSKTVSDGIYNLQGQKVSLDYAKKMKGVFILNGKKVVLK